MKCKFIKECPYYNKESEICNRDGGGYYDDGDGFQRYAGCWRDLEKKTKDKPSKKLSINDILNKFNITIVRSFPRHSIRFAKKHFNNNPITAIEVGTYDGKNAKNILKELNIKEIYLIDPYEEHEEYSKTEPRQTNETLNKAFLTARKRLLKSAYKINWIKEYSNEAIKIVPLADFIYIDGDHSYKQAKLDMQNYWNKLKDGGILAGHDITVSHDNYGVAKAFVEFCSEKKLKPYVSRTDWWVVKDEN